MLRSIAIFVLLSATTRGIQASEDVNFTREVDWQTNNPFTLRMGLELYTISINNKSIFINSTDAKFKPCNIIIDPLDDTIYGRMQATVLSGPRKIIVWGARSTEVALSTRKMYYTVLLVDPWSCDYQTLPVPDDEINIGDGETPISYALLPPQIVVRSDDKFDIFYPTFACSVCRYKNNGERISSSYYYSVPSMEPEITVPLHSFHIQPLAAADIQLGYFYAYNFKNNSALLKYLDSRLNWTRKKNVNHTIDAISINYGTYKNVAVCYRTHTTFPLPKDEQQKVYCERLNSKLQSVISVRLPTAEDQFISNITLKIDGKGNMFIGLIQSGQIRVFIYDVDARLVDSFNFGQVDESKYTYHDLNGILVNNQYCLEVVEQVHFGVHEAHDVIKCIDVRKYVGNS